MPGQPAKEVATVNAQSQVAMEIVLMLRLTQPDLQRDAILKQQMMLKFVMT